MMNSRLFLRFSFPFALFASFAVNWLKGEGAPTYISGKIVSLEPVRMQTVDKTLLSILPTSQMPIVQLSPAITRDLKSGIDTMFVLSRQSDNCFVASEIVLNASPMNWKRCNSDVG